MQMSTTTLSCNFNSLYVIIRLCISVDGLLNPLCFKIIMQKERWKEKEIR